MMAAKKKNTEGMAFIVETLKKDKGASYTDIKAAAEKKSLTVWPIMFGRAQLLLGHVKGAKRGTGRHAMAKAAAAGGIPRRGPGRPRTNFLPLEIPRRGPGRPRKNGLASPGFAGLDGVIAAVKDSQRDVGRYRGALERIQGILADALIG